MLNSRVSKRGGLPAAWLVLFAAAISATVHAQPYPSRSIRVVLPFAAGGGLDFVGRIAIQKLAAGLKQSVVADNRGGAGGNIGTEIVAKAPPDGYTLLIVSNSFTVNPSIYKNAPYDPIKDFAPVSMLTSYPLFLVVHPSVQVRSIKSLIALAKARPGALTYGSAGSGTTTHIGGELFAYMAGVKLTHIPYKGSAPSLPALISGEVAMSFAATSIVPHIRAGKVVLVAVTGSKRVSNFPDTPTIAEAGVPGYEATGWNALFAPAATDPAIIKRLSEVIVRGLNETDAMGVFQKQSLEQASGTPDALGAIVRTEVARWPKVVKAAGIEPVQ